MDKRMIALLIAMTFVHANASTPLFDFRQLDGDSANYAFINRFSDSRIFNCYKDGRVAFGIHRKNLAPNKEFCCAVRQLFLTWLRRPNNPSAIVGCVKTILRNSV